MEEWSASECVGYQYPYAAPIGSEIGVGHRERCRWGEDIAENIAICLWRHRVDAIGGCVVDWGQQHTEVCLLYGDKSMNKGLISEDRGNKATLLLTIPCSLLSRLQRIYRSQYLD